MVFRVCLSVLRRLPVIALLASVPAMADDGLKWQRSPDGYQYRSSGPDAERLCADRDFPDTGQLGDRRFRMHCARVGTFSRMHALYRHNVVRAGTAQPLPRDTFRPHFSGALERDIESYLDQFAATSFLILRDGKIVLEKYQYGRKPTDRFASFSMAKTMISLMVGLAADEKHLNSLDDPLTDYLPELNDTGWRGVSIRNILRMSSGVKWQKKTDVAKHAGDLLHRDVPTLSSLKRYTARDFVPGRKFSYNNADTSALTLLLAKVYGKRPSAVFEERIWQRIGATSDAFWLADVEGMDIGFAYFNATLRDYARLGLMLARGGRVDGVQVFPQEWIAALAGRDIQECPFAPRCLYKTWGYSYQTWLLPDRMGFFLWGVYGQLIIVLPQADVVIVQTGALDKPTFRSPLQKIVKSLFEQAVKQ